MEKLYFKDLDTTTWSGKTIILDIDGTITTDGGSMVDPLVLDKIKEISQHNFLFLFSNKKVAERNAALSNELGIPYLQTTFKKPNKKILESLPSDKRSNIIVVGDKTLTDGMFAKNIGASFVKVKRLTSKNDTLTIKLIYLLDAIGGYFWNIE